MKQPDVCPVHGVYQGPHCPQCYPERIVTPRVVVHQPHRVARPFPTTTTKPVVVLR
jgi:hypothetical protein